MLRGAGPRIIVFCFSLKEVLDCLCAPVRVAGYFCLCLCCGKRVLILAVLLLFRTLHLHYGSLHVYVCAHYARSQRPVAEESE